MYISLGKNTFLTEEEIIGVFDLDITSQSHLTREFLSGSEKRLWIFDKETGRFTREGLPEALLTEVVTAVYKYGNTVYAGTADGRILMTDDRLSEVRAIRADLGNCQINCLLQDSPSRLWVGTEGKGLWEVSLTDGTTRTAIRAGIGPNGLPR